MYMDFEDGKKKAKEGGVVWIVFGIIAAIFLILFFICSGTAKIIMGILCALNILFILVLVFLCFFRKGNKKEHDEVTAQVNKDMEEHEQILMDPKNRDFINEIVTWYILWNNGIKDPGAPEKMVSVGMNIQTCKHNGKSVIVELLDLYHNGVDIQKDDKIAIIDAGIKLADSMKNSERDIYKEKIVSIVSKYC